MKTLCSITCLLATLNLFGNNQKIEFTPFKNIVVNGKTTVYFVTQNAEKYDWVKWNFGDGTSEYSINPAHEYRQLGVYTVKMIVSKGAKIDTLVKENFVTILPAKKVENIGVSDKDFSKTIFKNNGNCLNNEVFLNFDNHSIEIKNKTNQLTYIEIRDINGNLIMNYTMEKDEINKTISTQELKSGYYLVMLKSDNGSTVKKIML